jgi:hypothetical protein
MKTHKTISIRQPHAWAILHAGKDIENRSRKTSHRGPILIHAGKTIDKQAVAQLTAEGYDVPEDLPTGGVVGTVEITDCVTDHPSRWAIAGENHWTLANAKALPFHPVAGQLGFFDVEIEPVYRDGLRKAPVGSLKAYYRTARMIEQDPDRESEHEDASEVRGWITVEMVDRIGREEFVEWEQSEIAVFA